MSGFTLCAFADEAGTELDSQISALKENNIGYLELRGVDGQNVSELTASQAVELKKKLDDAQISVWSVGSPAGKINISDDFTPHMEQFKHILEIAHITGASCIRLFSFYHPETDAGSCSYRDEVLKRLSRFCEAAKNSGVTLCHENEKGIYGDSAEKCLDLHTQLSGIKAVFDPANFVQIGQDVLVAWDLLAPYIHYVHIKDALPDGSVVPAGLGHGRIEEILNRYAAKGGRILTLEPHLAIFKGLDELEHGEKSVVSAFSYPNQRVAFDSGVNALKQILAKREEK